MYKSRARMKKLNYLGIKLRIKQYVMDSIKEINNTVQVTIYRCQLRFHLNRSYKRALSLISLSFVLSLEHFTERKMLIHWVLDVSIDRCLNALTCSIKCFREYFLSCCVWFLFVKMPRQIQVHFYTENSFSWSLYENLEYILSCLYVFSRFDILKRVCRLNNRKCILSCAV